MLKTAVFRFVKTAAQRERAVRIATETPAVSQVFNSIQLR